MANLFTYFEEALPRLFTKMELCWKTLKSHKILCSHIFLIHNDHTYITGDYTKLCLNIICNRTFFFFKRGYEEIWDKKLLEILKKDRTWLKYEFHCFSPFFSKIMLINVFPLIVFVRTFFLHISRESNKLAIDFYFFIPEIKQYGRS
jgi:hypothetical protein